MKTFEQKINQRTCKPILIGKLINDYFKDHGQPIIKNTNANLQSTK